MQPILPKVVYLCNYFFSFCLVNCVNEEKFQCETEFLVRVNPVAALKTHQCVIRLGYPLSVGAG